MTFVQSPLPARKAGANAQLAGMDDSVEDHIINNSDSTVRLILHTTPHDDVTVATHRSIMG